MKPEPPPMSETARDLFVAARREIPARAHRQRTLAEMIEASQKSSGSRVWALSIAAPILLAAAALLLMVADWQEQLPSTITAERTVVVPISEPVPTTSTSASPAASAEAHPKDTEKAPPRVKARPRAQRRVPSLSEEVEVLDRARTALNGGDPGTTLALLDTYDRQGARRLRAEAALLRIEALARSGRSGDAGKLAEDFVAKYPGSPLVDRARAFVVPQAAPNSSGNAAPARPQGVY